MTTLEVRFFSVAELTSQLPLEVVYAALGDTIMDYTHGVDHLFLDLIAAHNREFPQEVVSHGNESIFGPALEPIHGAPRDQSGEFERPLAELFSNLRGDFIEDVKYQYAYLTAMIFFINGPAFEMT